MTAPGLGAVGRGLDARPPARLLTGRDALPQRPTELRAGPLIALLDGPDLRHVAAGGVELVQRVYVALRDAPWNTIPATFSEWRVDARPDSFSVTFHAAHRHEAIAFDWQGRIEGTPEGVIRYEMDGVCRGAFQYSKVGFNVHHALDRAIGHRYRAQTSSGELTGVLPDAIDPQRIVDGKLSGMFEPYSSFALEVADRLEAVISLEGDLLELQDHRNWIDGNFKSYGTPLGLGFPFDATEGQRIRQVLTVSYRGTVPEAQAAGRPTIAVAAAAGDPLPAIGFGQSGSGRAMTAREAARIATVAPSHLRVDLSLLDPSHAGAFEVAAADARAVGAALELAIFANEACGPALDALAAQIRSSGVAVSRVLVYLALDGFSPVQGLTPAAVVRLVRDHLEPVVGAVPFAGGTNQNFTDINRDRPSDPALTGICFAASPTVHAADDASIVENLVGIREVIRMARAFSDGRPISISPITIATRFGPYPAGPASPGDLPPSVDVRQASLLGAAWTVGMLKYAAEAGAASVTAYETVGWRGIVESDAGSAMPDRFPSRPGDALPLYHVFADVGEWRGARIVAAPSSDPLKAAGLAVETEDGARHVLVAGLVPEPVEVELTGLTDGPVRVRRLDAETASTAMSDPSAFRAAGTVAQVAGGRLVLQLGPYAVARIDGSARPS